MKKLDAVNNVLIIKKDKSDDEYLTNIDKNTAQIPQPYTGYIDSIGCETEFAVGEHIAFCDLCGFLSFLENSDENFDLISNSDWKELSELVNCEAETLPIEILQQLMSILVEKGVF